jgi:segregation and condensation protein B
MNEHDLKISIEATLLAAGRPVPTQQLLELFDERERPTKEQLQAALEQLANDYADRGIELVEVASGWRIQVRPRCIDVVSRLWQERPAKYSRALLETLALVAYRQPITRSEIEEIRGVSISSTIMRTLQERNWIRVVGHREVPGRPELLGTTREFLDYFGLKSLDQLPTLAELRDVETIGVQLELPAGQPDAAGESAETGEAAANAAATAEAQSESAEQQGEATQDAAQEEAAAQLESADQPPESEVEDVTPEEPETETEESAATELHAEAQEDAEPEAELQTDSEQQSEAQLQEHAETEADDEESDSAADAGDEPELSADADEVDEEDTPTLVASSEDDAERRYGEPPRED